MIRNKDLLKMIVLSVVILAAGMAGISAFPESGVWIMACVGVLIIGTFMYYTWRRYRDIAHLAQEIHRFQRSSQHIHLEEYSEGELSYLSSEIGKLSVKLTEQAELLEADKTYLADAISDISHQLKTPLTSMSMMTDFLRSPDLPEEKRELFTANIRSQLARIEWLVSALLKMARLDAGAVQLKYVPVNVCALIEKASEHLRIPMELKDQKLIVQCDEDMYFNGDMDWMSEAVANILKNCMEHMDIGKTLKVCCQSNPMYMRMDITDEGCGIHKDDLPHIFERFYRGKNASSDSVGIGLAMAKQIIHRQNGEISVESTVGVGTHFIIKIYR